MIPFTAFVVVSHSAHHLHRSTAGTCRDACSAAMAPRAPRSRFRRWSRVTTNFLGACERHSIHLLHCSNTPASCLWPNSRNLRAALPLMPPGDSTARREAHNIFGPGGQPAGSTTDAVVLRFETEQLELVDRAAGAPGPEPHCVAPLNRSTSCQGRSRAAPAAQKETVRRPVGYPGARKAPKK